MKIHTEKPTPIKLAQNPKRTQFSLSHLSMSITSCNVGHHYLLVYCLVIVEHSWRDGTDFMSDWVIKGRFKYWQLYYYYYYYALSIVRPANMKRLNEGLRTVHKPVMSTSRFCSNSVSSLLIDWVRETRECRWWCFSIKQSTRIVTALENSYKPF